MNEILTAKLLKRFPVLYQDYNSPMTQTCMCWGFDHGDGWFDIIWQLSLAIEDELGYSRAQKWGFLFKKRFACRWADLMYRISPVVHDKRELVGSGTEDDPKRVVVVEKAKPRRSWAKRLIFFPNTGFAVDQVKEKFGTLRYYCPGTDRIHNFIRLAETLSGMTCEICGKPGRLGSVSGWYSTRCKGCERNGFEPVEPEKT